MNSLEVCIDSLDGLNACLQAGATRIELCSALSVGGLTPSVSLTKLAAQKHLSVYAMIRPRSGDFCFSDNDVSLMCDEIEMAHDAGVTGVVLGVTTGKGTLDEKALKRLSLAAGPLHTTLHRVFDTLECQSTGLEQAIDLGFNYILSSGGAPSVEQGVEKLAVLNEQAAGRIQFIAGSGLRPDLLPVIYECTGIDVFHASCRTAGRYLAQQPGQQPGQHSGQHSGSSIQKLEKKLIALGFSSASQGKTNVALIQEYLKALQ